MKASKINNVIAFGLIFIAPLIVIFRRYQGSEKTVQVEQGMGFIATTLILIITFGIVYMLIFHLKEMMKKSFRLTLIISGIVSGGLMFAAYFVTNYIRNLATANYEQFIELMDYHIETLYIILIFIAGGLLVAGGEYILKLSKMLKSAK